MNRPRVIKGWTRQYIASRDYECDFCGDTIHATTLYERSIVADGRVLKQRRIHAKPNCPDRYINY